jgi:hypothetical protein
VSVANEIGVGEISRVRVEPRRAQSAGARRHHAAIRRDRDEVQQAAHRHDPHEPQIEIAQDARGCQAVGRDVADAVERGVA